MEIEQHGQDLDELQQLQREQMKRGHQAQLAELDQHQQHLAELQVQQELQEQQQQEEAELHQINVAQQQQIIQQQEVEHVQQVVANNQALRALPVACHPYQEPAARNSLGPMDVECPHCHALHFKCEKLTNSSVVNPKFGICCLQGQIQLPPISQPPPLLHKLLMLESSGMVFNTILHLLSPRWLSMLINLS